MLKFQPKPGSIIYCDYRGFIAPEMVKKRPVIVISKHKHNSRLLGVVPISTTEPVPALEYHIQMDPVFCEINLSSEKSWVKCDMVNVVSLERLNLVRNKHSGQRDTPNVGVDFLNKIKEAVKKAHNL